MQINMHEAKSQLSKLAKKVCEGETVVIAKSGKPCVELKPYISKSAVRKPGAAKDQIKLKADLLAEDKEVQALFEG